MRRFLLFLSITAFQVMACLHAGAQNPTNSQTKNSGQTTDPILFPTGCTYNWTNSNPSIGLAINGSGPEIAPFTAVNTGATPAIANIKALPIPTAFSYITNMTSNNVSVINNNTNTVVATIPVGNSPDAVAFSPDGGTLYVANYLSGTITTVNTATNVPIAKTIDVPGGPEAMVTSPDGTTLYVASSVIDKVSVVDANAGIVDKTITVGSNPAGIALSPDGSKLYVVNSGSNTVSVINTSDLSTATVNVGTNPLNIVLSPDGTKAYVTNFGSKSISVINTADNSVTTFPNVGAQQPWGIATNAAGSVLYVTDKSSNTVFVINATSGNIINAITVGSGPTGISLSPNGSQLYVTNTQSSNVSVINTTTNAVTTVNVGTGPQNWGSFVKETNGCSEYDYTIIVNPAATSPTVTIGPVTGTISACAGTPSVAPNIQQVTVSGNNLSENITGTAPANFEISLDPNTGYGPSVTIPETGGVVLNQTVYIRSSATASAGPINGVLKFVSGSGAQATTVSGTIKPVPVINAINNQGPYTDGGSTNQILFSGTADTYTWTNDKPGIGLANGSGLSIPSFTVVNKGTANIVATITVTPVINGGCSGLPVTFTITVEPKTTKPTINATAASGIISACQGTPSSAPYVQQFTISGSNLTSPVTVSAPAGLEVSLSKNGPYSVSLSVTPTATVYVRSSANAVAGVTSSQLTLSATGATDQKVAISGVISPLPTATTTGAPFTYYNGDATQLIKFAGTANIFTWTNDKPVIGLAGTGTGNIPTFTAVNTTTSDIIANITVVPELKALGYVANNISNSVTVFNTLTNTKITDIPLSPNRSPLGVAITPDGNFAYVTNSASDNVSVINTTTNQVIKTIPVGSFPWGIAASPDGTKIYVANTSANNISVISTLTNTVVNTIYNSQFNNPVGVVFSPDGSKAFVSNNGSDYIFVINTATDAVVQQLTVGTMPYGIAVSPDGSRIFVVDNITNDVYVFDGNTYTLITKIVVDDSPYTAAVSPDGNRLYVTCQGTSNILVFDAKTYAPITTISLSSSPISLSVSADDKLVYVTTSEGNIKVISTIDNSVITNIPAGSNPSSLGTFITNGEGCAGAPLKFTITVKPRTTPSIAVGPVTGTISACEGYASSDPNILQFTLSGTNLTDDVTVQIPTFFEISQDKTTWYGNATPLVIAQKNGTVENTVIYVRTASNAPSTSISALVKVSSTGATPQTEPVTATVSPSPTVDPKSDQGPYTNGQQTDPITFFGIASTYSWVNNNPAIGLAASGTGNIPSFTALNTGTTPIVGSITVTPTTGNCSGVPITFTITVDPGPVTSTITTSGNTISVNTTYGTPSAPTTFIVSGTNIDNGIVVTPPPGFEVSLDGKTYSPTVTIPGSDNINDVTVYIRLTGTSGAGTYGGDITVTSNGAPPAYVSMPDSHITPAPLVITADKQTKVVNTPNPNLTVSYSGFVNGDGASVLNPQATVTTTALLDSPVGQYTITASGAASPNYDISYVPGILIITPLNPTIVVPNTFTPNGDEINDVWNIKNLENYPNCTVNIYNRYGEKVYSSVGYPIPWDGKYKGSYLPSGVYFYIINPKNNQKVISGNVTIIR